MATLTLTHSPPRALLDQNPLSRVRTPIVALPFPVQYTSTQASSSILKFNLKATRTAKLALTATIACLGLIATWIALDVAMWTAAKEWRDDCREQQAANLTISARCEEILSKELVAPPGWRNYLRLPDVFGTGYAKMRYEGSSVSHDEEGFVERDEVDGGMAAGYRGILASRSPTPYYKRLLRELIGDYHDAEEGIRKQGDPAFMYGGMESYDRSGVSFGFWSGHIWSVNVSRTNPIPAPNWWVDDELEIAWLRQSEEFKQLDWSVLGYHLNIFSEGRISTARQGSGSVEMMSLWINHLDDSMTRRRTRESVRNRRLAVGPVIFWDGPEWLLLERAKAWLLGLGVLLAFVYVDGRHWSRRGTERKDTATDRGRSDRK
jgi:hypothetical protein